MPLTEVIALLTNPAVVGAFCTLLGVLVTVLVQNGSKKREHSLTVLQVEVEYLRTELNEVRGRVDELYAERDLLSRKLRAALDWARNLIAWGEEVAGSVDVGVDVPVAPAVPALLVEDY